MDARTGRRRAVGFDEYRSCMARMFTAEGVAAGLQLETRPGDVIISPFAKCGTTWLQQIVHSLRTGGDLDFDDVSRVVPWIETAADLGLDLQAPQRAEPRAFKSHLSWGLVPKGARYVVSLRNPGDALVSMYRFMEGWFFEPGSIDIETFARRQFLDRSERRDYWTHLCSWWRRRDDDDVLLLAYEHMKRDLPGTVRRVARFIDVAADDARIAVACEQASLESMKAHQSKYDNLLMRERSESVCGLPPGSDSTKVRSGQSGGHRQELSADLRQELDAMWQSTVDRELGLPSYDALLTELAPSGPKRQAS